MPFSPKQIILIYHFYTYTYLSLIKFLLFCKYNVPELKNLCLSLIAISINNLYVTLTF